MKDLSQWELESNRPADLTARRAIDFVLRRLYADEQYTVVDTVVDGLTFEELIGALLLARDGLRGFDEE